MTGITASGLGSGMDISSLVSQLVAAERSPATSRLDSRETKLKAQISAIGSFKSVLSNFQSSLASLKKTETFQSMKATVADDKLFAATVEVAPGVRVLGATDMVIHSATHLFHEGEFGHGLRDLWDLHQLMCEFGAQDAGFWDALTRRATELDLADPLYYGMRYANRCFGTPVPDAALHADIRSRRSTTPIAVMDFLFDRVFVPDHPDCLLPGTALARQCLYVRSHYLRMPLHLLLPHLARKAWMGIYPPAAPVDADTSA